MTRETITAREMWKAASLKEQERLMEEAMRETGSVTKSALRLGISRRHLTRVRRETRRLIETGETPGLAETDETKGLARTSRGGETVTPLKSLTYGRPAPTLHPMSTATATAHQQVEADPVSRVAFDLRKHHTDWLDQEALRRKQERGESRPSKSRILIDLIEQAMAAAQPRPTGKPPNGKAEGKKR